MRAGIVKFFMALVLCLQCTVLLGQDHYLLSGTVKDALTGEGVSFANVSVEGQFGYGAESDIDGKFKFYVPVHWKQVRLQVSFVGYQRKSVELKAPFSYVDVKLKEEVSELGEVVFEAGENPAYSIIRQAASRKSEITEKKYKRYRNRSFNNVEVSLTNLKGIENIKLVREAKKYVVGLQQKNANADTSLIPLLVSESLVENYKKGGLFKEKVLRRRLKGVGVDETDEIVDLVNEGTIHGGDLNENTVTLLDKAIHSPLSDYWKVNYKVWLVDSLEFEGRPTYKIEVEPRIGGSLAFEGMLWIDKEDKALVQADLKLSGSANINFINRFELFQKMERQPNGEWFKARYLVSYDISDFFEDLPGVLLTYDYRYRDYQPEAEVPSSVFEKKFEIYVEDKQDKDVTYWKGVQSEFRGTDTVQSVTLNSLQVIDSINNLGSVKSLSKWLRFFVNGYTDGEVVNWGKYQNTAAYNNVERLRLGLGFRFNLAPNRRWVLIPNAAYGFRDRRWKYDVKLFYNTNLEKGTYFGAELVDELMPLSLLELETGVNPWVRTLARWGDLKKKNPYYRKLQRVFWSSFVKSDVRLEASLSHDELRIWNFRNKTEKSKEKRYLGIDLPLETAESTLGVVYTKHKKAVLTKNNELKLIPPLNDLVFESKLHAGYFNDRDHGQWEPYGKLTLKARQMYVPLLGVGSFSYWANAGYVFTEAPYQLLRVHQGTEMPLSFNGVIRGMNEFEFVSDYYMELRLEHYFEGRLASAVPGLRHLNRWLGVRFLLLGDVVWGGMSAKNKVFNKGLIGNNRWTDDGLQQFNVLRPDKPFVDAGIGVENIFRLIRLELTRRLNYNDTDYRAKEWRLKVSAAFKF
ncbi:MAG: DUF5686 and carboxypeptidase regulatory-like domain-containing protein [Cytophagales bacterium]|nr:DUF5686 and carboxypeptidase regulatory-like domain-containing protein [Cytophagales bacterium]